MCLHEDCMSHSQLCDACQSCISDQTVKECKVCLCAVSSCHYESHSAVLPSSMISGRMHKCSSSMLS